MLKFRVASNSRRRAADGTWEPGNSLFVTVNCWGRLVSGVGASLGKGSPVIVSGHVYTSEYEDRDGNPAVDPGDARHRRRPRSVSLHRARREDGLVRIGGRRRPMPSDEKRPPTSADDVAAGAEAVPSGAAVGLAASDDRRCLGWGASNHLAIRKATPPHG